MNSKTDKAPAPFILHAPALQTAPVIIASPHSGRYYPAEFIAQSPLDALALRQSEDSYVDEIMSFAPSIGLPLLTATYPRAYIDLNREAYELDPAMFTDALPHYARNVTDRVKAGFGTVPSLIAAGMPIYDTPLAFADVKRRIEAIYHPYHKALRQLIENTHQNFGEVLLIDAHSMPKQTDVSPAGGNWQWGGSTREPDMVIGDRHGTTCDPTLSTLMAEELMGLGYTVHMNTPYAGGQTTRQFGNPQQKMHALQIEIRRELYMDEPTRTRKSAALSKLSHDFQKVFEILIAARHTRDFANAAQ